MKRVIVILLTLSLILSLTACGGSGTTSAGSTESARSEAEPAEEPAQSKAEPDAEPAQSEAEPAEEPAQSEAEPAAEPARSEAEAATQSAAEAASDAAQSAAASGTAAASPAEPSANTAAVGSYKMTGYSGELEDNLKSVATIVSMGGNFYLTLKEDGTGSLNFLEAEIPFEWNDSNIILQPEDKELYPDSVNLDYTYDEGTLNVGTRRYSLDFQSLTDEELADYNKNGAGSLNNQVGKLAEKIIGGMDNELVNNLIMDLAFGMMGFEEPEPIPEGEPSEGTVTGVVSGLNLTILGTDHLQSSGKDYLALYYDITNTTEDVHDAWELIFEACQDGAYLESTWEEETVPEVFNCNLDILPGRTLRCAEIFDFDPNGGVIGMRARGFIDENILLYYADPQNLTGAPEPYVFGADPSIPAYLEELPAETEDVRIENAEFYTDENGDKAVRFYIRFKNTYAEDTSFYDKHFIYTFQDGIELAGKWFEDVIEEESNCSVAVKPGEEIVCARAFKVRTDSPVVFVVEEIDDDYSTFNEAAYITEVKEP